MDLYSRVEADQSVGGLTEKIFGRVLSSMVELGKYKEARALFEQKYEEGLVRTIASFEHFLPSLVIIKRTRDFDHYWGILDRLEIMPTSSLLVGVIRSYGTLKAAGDAHQFFSRVEQRYDADVVYDLSVIKSYLDILIKSTTQFAPVKSALSDLEMRGKLTFDVMMHVTKRFQNMSRESERFTSSMHDMVWRLPNILHAEIEQHKALKEQQRSEQKEDYLPLLPLVRHFESLVEMSIEANNTKLIQNAIQLIKKAKIRPTSRSYSKLFRFLLVRNDPETIKTIIKNSQEWKERINIADLIVFYESYPNMLTGPIFEKDYSRCMDLLWSASGDEPKELRINQIIEVFLLMDNLAKALEWADRFDKEGSKRTAAFYLPFLSYYTQVGNIEKYQENLQAIVNEKIRLSSESIQKYNSYFKHNNFAYLLDTKNNKSNK
ncbi:hypothetical protein DFA_10922 [Cavenderia fasciculata]|uniref:Uncharacterized protein n=1 Tax=Cavenderia fasciculata TaxID=261658 RepID=F4QBS6_CACFS|nr:uncharacterized protein DFA_10922 [Cavenderia fasciculata]EGG14664.1 hypothetical protein DFA_10922 [Cavenderia fasciculata]|eukprot:XP_004351172.1 hypothetical protein DFA_10922 [Cavenderia fasciculata]